MEWLLLCPDSQNNKETWLQSRTLCNGSWGAGRGANKGLSLALCRPLCKMQARSSISFEKEVSYLHTLMNCSLKSWQLIANQTKARNASAGHLECGGPWSRATVAGASAYRLAWPLLWWALPCGQLASHLEVSSSTLTKGGPTQVLGMRGFRKLRQTTGMGQTKCFRSDWLNCTCEHMTSQPASWTSLTSN